ncbi:hypothetical protein HMI55_003138 [Coelomomyces lativittatus]|nr:hypothetical protein HMI55_003138 [Coelomomyces lativittatus]
MAQTDITKTYASFSQTDVSNVSKSSSTHPEGFSSQFASIQTEEKKDFSSTSLAQSEDLKSSVLMGVQTLPVPFFSSSAPTESLNSIGQTEYHGNQLNHTRFSTLGFPSSSLTLPQTTTSFLINSENQKYKCSSLLSAITQTDTKHIFSNEKDFEKDKEIFEEIKLESSHLQTERFPLISLQSQTEHEFISEKPSNLKSEIISSSLLQNKTTSSSSNSTHTIAAQYSEIKDTLTKQEDLYDHLSSCGTATDEIFSENFGMQTNTSHISTLSANVQTSMLLAPTVPSFTQTTTFLLTNVVSSLSQTEQQEIQSSNTQTGKIHSNFPDPSSNGTEIERSLNFTKNQSLIHLTSVRETSNLLQEFEFNKTKVLHQSEIEENLENAKSPLLEMVSDKPLDFLRTEERLRAHSSSSPMNPAAMINDSNSQQAQLQMASNKIKHSTALIFSPNKAIQSENNLTYIQNLGSEEPLDDTQCINIKKTSCYSQTQTLDANFPTIEQTQNFKYCTRMSQTENPRSTSTSQTLMPLQKSTGTSSRKHFSFMIQTNPIGEASCSVQTKNETNPTDVGITSVFGYSTPLQTLGARMTSVMQEESFEDKNISLNTSYTRTLPVISSGSQTEVSRLNLSFIQPENIVQRSTDLETLGASKSIPSGQEHWSSLCDKNEV